MLSLCSFSEKARIFLSDLFGKFPDETLQVLRDGKEVQVAVPTVVAGDIVACLELLRGSLDPRP